MISWGVCDWRGTDHISARFKLECRMRRSLSYATIRISWFEVTVWILVGWGWHWKVNR